MGTTTVTITVSDGDGGTDSAFATVIEAPTNQPPSIRNAAVTTTTGKLVRTLLDATDPDSTVLRPDLAMNAMDPCCPAGRARRSGTADL